MQNLNSNEIKNQLLKMYPFRIEMHAHTKPASACSEILPEEMVEIYNNKGYNGIVITNHFIYNNLSSLPKDEAIKKYLSDYEKTKSAAEKNGLKIYLGCEIRFTENINDYLIYGVDEQILSKCYDYLQKGIETFRKEVDLSESVFIQAHPCRDNITECDPSLLDGMETFNMHPGHNGRIGFSVRYASNNNLKIKTAGSDFHHKNRGHEAVAALRTKILPDDSFGIAEILKSGDYIFEIGEDSIVLP